MDTIERYEEGIEPARSRFGSAPAIEEITSWDVDPELMEAFCISFCALGVGMTEPVEGWIRRAGERCAALGCGELGAALYGHAKAEAGHHLMMMDDVRGLCARWNSAPGRPPLDPDELLALPRTEAVERYRQLHEDVIAGPAPYAQIAVENEIEMLSVEYGPKVLANCARHLGGQIASRLSFLVTHIDLDRNHTQFNRRQMRAFLETRPEAVDPLVEAGSAALDAYGDFIADCVEHARALAMAVE
ncbi:MAG: hypothetical protein ACRDZO_07555 [Egibacteraceae bacterium]